MTVYECLYVCLAVYEYLVVSSLLIGCKIKALRAKTNTYIKTPVRGDEPVFVVTGRREDVASAKREILSAAEHFSQIRASRRNLTNRPTNNVSSVGGAPSVGGGGGPAGAPTGQVTQEVRVPFRVVGLVVGPKGATVKRIQQETQTYIVTPSRDKDPVFEIIGTPENVERAKREIESYISLRTKGELTSSGCAVNNSWTNLNNHHQVHHQPRQQQSESSLPSSDERQSSRTTADLLGLLLQNPAIDGNNSIFTSYNNILNLGLGQLRLSKTSSSARIANAVSSSSELAAAVGGGRPFSLDAADLFDAQMTSDLQQQQQFPLSAKWRSYESDDILCTASSSSSSSSSSPDQQQQKLQGRSPLWPEMSHGLLAPIFAHQGAADQIGRDGLWCAPCDDHSAAAEAPVNMHVHEAILGMCVGSLYAGSLFNSSCPDVTLVPGNVVHLSSGSVSDSSSTSPTDFGLLINNNNNNQDFERKPCAMSDANKVESATRCPTCY